MLLALAFAVKLLSVGYLGAAAAQAFTRGDHSGVASAAAGLGLANFLERHKAPFAAGDALVLRGDYAGARAQFEASLAIAARADECKVRVNLVLSIERLGDERLNSGARTGDAPADGAVAEDARMEAARLYAEGLAVGDAAPPGCFSAESPGGDTSGADGEGDRLRQAEARLRDKAEQLRSQDGQAAQPDDGADGKTQPAPDPRQSQLERLKESGKAAQRERSDGMQREDYLEDFEVEPGTDKPW
jgi:hypothetical protein